MFKTVLVFLALAVAVQVYAGDAVPVVIVDENGKEISSLPQEDAVPMHDVYLLNQ